MQPDSQRLPCACGLARLCPHAPFHDVKYCAAAMPAGLTLTRAVIWLCKHICLFPLLTPWQAFGYMALEFEIPQSDPCCSESRQVPEGKHLVIVTAALQLPSVTWDAVDRNFYIYMENSRLVYLNQKQLRWAGNSTMYTAKRSVMIKSFLVDGKTRYRVFRIYKALLPNRAENTVYKV